ncbi:MAG TPA: hypothetical protein VF807_00460 [Ktedonobacterales bacterium]
MGGILRWELLIPCGIVMSGLVVALVLGTALVRAIQRMRQEIARDEPPRE